MLTEPIFPFSSLRVPAPARDPAIPNHAHFPDCRLCASWAPKKHLLPCPVLSCLENSQIISISILIFLHLKSLSFRDLGFKWQLQHICYCIILHLYMCKSVYIHVPTYMCICTYIFHNICTPYIHMQKQEKEWEAIYVKLKTTM